MLLLIIALLIIIIGMFVYDNILKAALIVIGGFIITINLLILINVPYSFENWVARRDAIVQSLESSRKNYSEIETAGIINKVVDFNIVLADNQYRNTLWIWDSYIDDRVDSLKFIQ